MSEGLPEELSEQGKELLGQEKDFTGDLRDSSVHAEYLNITKEVTMLLQARLLVGTSSILVGFIVLLRTMVNLGSSDTSQLETGLSNEKF